jgi:GNAT superfamily N-acetyltransferase
MIPIRVRPVEPADFAAWKPLWDAYNAFYGRAGETALPDDVTRTTWQRFFDPGEAMFALVAEGDNGLLGLTHFLFHRSTSRIALTCYLQDLFTLPAARGQGVGRALIEAVYSSARAHGLQRVYWQTHESNAAGRRLYDQVADNEGFIVYSRTL